MFWFEKFMNNDYSGMTKDGRVHPGSSFFYTDYPEIERSASIFAFEKCHSKTANFKVQDLARFITAEYIKLTNDASLKPTDNIRSISR
jgi:hypothetical protein